MNDTHHSQFKSANVVTNYRGVTMEASPSLKGTGDKNMTVKTVGQISQCLFLELYTY